MHGELTEEQIDEVLASERLGRIGCHAEGRTYVVPISYAYDGGAVYAHSADGLKVRTMRENPSVCFEVEQIVDEASWKTVVCWGTYEELSGQKEQWAMDRLGLLADLRGRAIVYRIALTEKTGRFERQPATPATSSRRAT